MAYNQCLELMICAQQNEPFLILRMVRIKELQRMFIIKRRACLFERNTMLRDRWLSECQRLIGSRYPLSSRSSRMTSG